MSRSAAASTWQVVGIAYYAAAGSYSVGVSVQDVDGSTVSSSSEVRFTVSAPALADTTPMKTYGAIEGNAAKSLVLATFSDTSPLAQAGDFTPTVTWGATPVGTPTAQVQLVKRTKTATTWQVVGSVAYAEKGTYSATVLVQGPGRQRRL